MCAFNFLPLARLTCEPSLPSALHGVLPFLSHADPMELHGFSLLPSPVYLSGSLFHITAEQLSDSSDPEQKSTKQLGTHTTHVLPSHAGKKPAQQPKQPISSLPLPVTAQLLLPSTLPTSPLRMRPPKGRNCSTCFLHLPWLGTQLMLSLSYFEKSGECKDLIGQSWDHVFESDY